MGVVFGLGAAWLVITGLIVTTFMYLENKFNRNFSTDTSLLVASTMFFIALTALAFFMKGFTNGV